jgi:hypothetical protein
VTQQQEQQSPSGTDATKEHIHMSNYDRNADDLIFGGGARGFSMLNIGDIAKGVVKAVDVTQQKDFSTKELKTWPNGDPMMQTVFTMQTDLRDADDDEDDGERRLYIDSKAKREAVRDALVAVGIKSVYQTIGGTLALQYSANDPASKNPQNPRKLYVAQFVPGDPLTNGAVNLITTAPAPAPQPVAPVNGGVATSLI